MLWTLGTLIGSREQGQVSANASIDGMLDATLLRIAVSNRKARQNLLGNGIVQPVCVGTLVRRLLRRNSAHMRSPLRFDHALIQVQFSRSGGISTRFWSRGGDATRGYGRLAEPVRWLWRSQHQYRLQVARMVNFLLRKGFLNPGAALESIQRLRCEISFCRSGNANAAPRF